MFVRYFTHVPAGLGVVQARRIETEREGPKALEDWEKT